MKRFVTSRLGEEHRDALEQMFYFHPEQSYFKEALFQHVQQFGSPQIVHTGNLISISIPSLPGAQTLYALEQDEAHVKLLGVMVIHRTDETLLEMHHIAISPQFTRLQRQESVTVASLLIGELFRIGRRIRGIEKIKLAYNRSKISIGLDFPIDQDSACDGQ